MTTFVLPTSSAADDTLAELGHLATAVEWQRASIVYAQVLPHGQRKEKPGCTAAIQRVTANQFSKRGIHGLTSPHTVAAYRDAWQWAVDAGLAQPAVLGAAVELPDVPWDERNAPLGDDVIGVDDEPDEQQPLDAWLAASEKANTALVDAVVALDDMIAVGRDIEARGTRFRVPEDFCVLMKLLRPLRPVKFLPTPLASDGIRGGEHPDARRRNGNQVDLVDVVSMFVGEGAA